MYACKFATLAVLLSCGSVVASRPPLMECRVPALTESGWVCGTIRRAEGYIHYASFRGVPYAKQPLGELRFKELEKLDKWSGFYNATTEGPICPQTDVVFDRMMQPQGMSEACIHANIHVPLENLPYYQGRITRDLVSPHQTAFQDSGEHEENSGLPIVVFIHGGGFAFGSGDADVYGPEYLVSKNVIVITFNYRLNVMGFLSLNTANIPGNNGLRDMVTLLRWVQRNARAFGGNPHDVTLAGQSAGSSSAHLLSLSPVTDGLFKRVWLMSGVGAGGYYSTSPAYAQFIANMFLTALGYNSTDPEKTYRQLIDTPIEKIVETNKALLEQLGLTTFTPVVESPLPGVTPILDDDPEILVAKGRGKDIPLVVGFTNKECETFRPRFEKVDITSRIKAMPILVVSPQLIYSTPPTELLKIMAQINEQYFNGTVDIDKFVNLCSDQYFKYPAMKLAAMRSETGGAPVYLYQFAYNNEYNPLREALNLVYHGGAHMEDLTYVFRVNSILRIEPVYPFGAYEDSIIKDKMTKAFTNFMETSNPAVAGDSSCDQPSVTERPEILDEGNEIPVMCLYKEPTEQLLTMKNFFDGLHNMNRPV